MKGDTLQWNVLKVSTTASIKAGTDIIKLEY
jgi:hypothetical protein